MSTASTQGPPVTKDCVTNEPVAVVDGLHVEFGSGADAVTGVEDVSFSVSRGEVLALVGESGSGKTVTAQAMLGLLPGSATATGSVRLTTHDGSDREVVGASERTWTGLRGRSAAMVFQEPQTALNPVRTVGWLLAEAVRAHRTVTRAEARARAVELLDLVGIDEPETRVDAYPHQLSGGQKQRVVIALALVSDPALLIADEPTTALDVTVQVEILRLLGDLRDRLGTAIVLITHNMGVVADLADRVVVMRHGRMVEQGEVVSLFSAPFTDYTRSLLAAVPRLPLGSSITEVAPVREPASSDRLAALELTGVDVVYPGRLGRPAFQALTGIDVRLEPGRVLGVVGESGSGKTTLGRAAVGALRPSAGTIRLGGVDLTDPKRLSRAELRTVRRGLGVVHQDPATTLDPLLSVGESIAEPLQVHRVVSGRARRARVDELLESVSLPRTFAHRRPSELSGGQRQRVALARALALRPALLIADEPTSALDVSVQASVLALFAELQAELGFACVFISHDLAVVHEVSDDVLVMRHGVVVESGPSAVVLTRPQTDYTRALLDAVPRPDPVEQRARRPVALVG